MWTESLVCLTHYLYSGPKIGTLLHNIELKEWNSKCHRKLTDQVDDSWQKKKKADSIQKNDGPHNTGWEKNGANNWSHTILPSVLLRTAIHDLEKNKSNFKYFSKIATLLLLLVTKLMEDEIFKLLEPFVFPSVWATKLFCNCNLLEVRDLDLHRNP